MRKRGVWAAAALLVLLAASGCGGQADGGGTETAEVSLTALYAGMAESCGWEEGYMTGIEGELLEEYYPELCEIPVAHLIVRVPAMSSDVNEITLVQCGNEEDAEKAEAALQARIDRQLDGGAWYPETLESWKKAKVLRQGTYAALIASGEFQAELERQFQDAFS